MFCWYFALSVIFDEFGPSLKTVWICFMFIFTFWKQKLLWHAIAKVSQITVKRNTVIHYCPVYVWLETIQRKFSKYWFFAFTTYFFAGKYFQHFTQLLKSLPSCNIGQSGDDFHLKWSKLPLLCLIQICLELLLLNLGKEPTNCFPLSNLH